MKFEINKYLAISGKISYMVTVYNDGMMIFNEEVKSKDDLKPIADLYGLQLPERI